MKKNQRLNNTSVVLVDFFDTIVNRVHHPEWSKMLACKYVLLHCDERFDVNSIYRERLEIEKHLYAKSKFLFGDEEYLLKDMYEMLCDRLGLVRTLADEFTGKEIEIELQAIRPNLANIAAIFKLVSESRRIEVHLASDSYLPQKFFNSAIEKLALPFKIEVFHISSELRATKMSGNLYKKILEAHHLNASNFTMIGDNIHSDIQQARAFGINTFHLPSTQAYNFYNRALKRGFQVSETIESSKSDFDNLALLLLDFVQRLYLTIRSGIDLCFLSREGLFLKRCFDFYAASIENPKKISTSYLLASRKSTFLASVSNLTSVSCSNFFSQYNKLTAGKIIDNLCIAPSELDFEIDEKKALNPTLNSPDFVAFDALLSQSEVFREKKNAVSQNLEEYLAHFLKNDSLYLVDVGWKGTIQDNLARLKSVRQIEGYYLGLLEDIGSLERSRKHGICFDYRKNSKIEMRVLTEMTSLLELALNASHPSPKTYKKVDGVIEVVLESDSSEFSVGPQIQEKIFESFSRLMAIDAKQPYLLNDYRPQFVAKLLDTAITPSNELVQIIKRARHFENFGDTKTVDIASKNFSWMKAFTNILNPKRLKNELLAFTWWRGLDYKLTARSSLSYILKFKLKKELLRLGL